jgi:hypothetical protein
VSLLFWLPDRPLPPGEVRDRSGWLKFLPKTKPALTGEDARIHYEDLTRVYNRSMWNMKDLMHVILDWRLYPLVIMYFGVVGVGNGVQAYATVIIRGINPSLNGIQLSLLSAPIWLVSTKHHRSDSTNSVRWTLQLSCSSLHYRTAFTATAHGSLAVQL